MSASLTPTVATVPSGTEVATGLLALMTALTAFPTDINPGSQIRVLAQSIGAVVEEEGIGGQALALQALAYGAMSLFGIAQAQAQPASGVVTFATFLPLSAAFNAPQAITIPSGTLMQTQGGIQFSTVSNVILASGTTNVTAGIICTSSGSIGNVASGAITGAPLTPVGYPLLVTNGVPTQGGVDAGTQSQAIALFTAKAASLGLSSPVAIANAVIGVVATGTGEIVSYSSVYEPWIAAGSGAGSGTAGFTLYVDNGSGTSSPSLLATVVSYINGNVTQNLSGFRPAGVPYIVSGAAPVYANVAITGTLTPGLLTSGNVAATLVSGVTNYFNLIGIAPAAAYQPQIAGQVADAGAGAFASLAVNLMYSGSSTPVPVVSGVVGTRVILNSISLVLS